MTMKALCVLFAIDGTRQALAEQAGGQPINARPVNARPIAASGLSPRTEPAACYLVNMRIHS
jgi:hypothetical protein